MKKKATDKLERIFDATISLTGRVGIAGLKMSDIAKEVGIASGTLYIYFSSKEELLNTLYSKIKKESTSLMAEKIDYLPTNIHLYKIWQTTLRTLFYNSSRTIFLEQFIISPYISDENKALHEEFTEYLKHLLDKGKVEGLIKDIDNDILISLLTGFARDFSFYLVSNELKPTPKLIDQSFSLCWDAIKS